MSDAIQKTGFCSGLMLLIAAVSILSNQWQPLLSEVMIAIGLFSLLSLLCFYDISIQRLPNPITYALIFIGLVLNSRLALGELLLFPSVKNAHSLIFDPPILGATIGFLSFWSIGKLWKIVRGFQALGVGDAKLLAAAGAWLGIYALPLVILLASSSALSVVGILFIRTKKIPSLTTRIAFGPYIALAFWTLYCAQQSNLFTSVLI